MRRLSSSLPWLLLALALAALWRVDPPAAEIAPPPVPAKASVALATVTLPPPPPLPAASQPRPPVPKIAPLRVAPVAPEPAVPTVVPLRPSPPPEPKPRPKPVVTPPAPEPVNPDDGRALLVLLEHGRGPRIAIDWPGGGVDRRLSGVLVRCHGMQVAVLDTEGRLWREADPAGQHWQVNRDRFSGFLRVGAGDRAQAARIRRQHRIAGEPARLFPRSVDAGLLASLGRLVGPRYAKAEDIRLRYRLRAGAVMLDTIRVDGVPVGGEIALPRDGYCRA